MIGPYNKLDFPMTVLVQMGDVPHDDTCINWNIICESTLTYKEYNDNDKTDWVISDQLGYFCHYDDDYECFFSQNGDVYFNQGESAMRILYKDKDIDYIKERMEYLLNISQKNRFCGGFKESIIKASNKKGILNYSKFETTEIALYSATMPWHIEKIYKVLNNFLPEYKNFETIIDGTSNIGVDALHFAKKTSAIVTAVEIDKNEFDVLNKNIEKFELGNRIKSVNESIYDYLETIKHVDMIYLDPPWGGPDYYKTQELMLELDEKPIYHIVNLIFEKELAKYIILKLPHNFGYANFKENLNEGINNYKYKIDNNVDILILSKPN